MNRSKCPRCGSHTYSWDARAQAFLCLSVGCRAFTRPPKVSGLTRTQVSQEITRGTRKVRRDRLRDESSLR